MKDLAWWGVFMLLMVGSELLEDYRAERCVDHGGAWIVRSGCDSNACDLPKKKVGAP